MRYCFLLQHAAPAIVALALAQTLVSCKRTPPPAPVPPSATVLRGADFSQLPKIEAENYAYLSADSVPADPLELLASSGANVVRLKVWNNPTGDGSLAELRPLVARIKALDMTVMLTLHYSNTWADPGAQSAPTQWATLTFEEVLDSVEDFTFRVVRTLEPEYVQIGNEINHGFLHPFGVRDESGHFQRLLLAGLQGAHRADSTCQTLLHFAGYDQASAFFASVDSLPYDALGLSYYPRWHGNNLGELANTVQGLTQAYRRPCYVVETSYPFTLGWNDWTNNHIGDATQLHPNYPATPEGQALFLRDLRTMTDSLQSGLLYWGGELVAYKGPQSTEGSPYENQALFNFNGVELPALKQLLAP